MKLTRLKELREKYNSKQTELAEYLNVSNQAISSYETGAREPTIENLIKISIYFNVSVDYLLGLSDVRHTIEVERQKIVIEKEKLRKVKEEINKLIINI